ncbi:hypothetical protein [Lederbergia citrea]|uniref:hypothetical protein n=1 Tax=Lederbergia citrea TaxID=2833581 RepID=UPI001BCA267E|nr:hypothetical protein [Lederbergia citrea]MBS4205727.1 hypothetical protein [Lederbergia citrea]
MNVIKLPANENNQRFRISFGVFEDCFRSFYKLQNCILDFGVVSLDYLTFEGVIHDLDVISFNYLTVDDVIHDLDVSSFDYLTVEGVIHDLDVLFDSSKNIHLYKMKYHSRNDHGRPNFYTFLSFNKKDYLLQSSLFRR